MDKNIGYSLIIPYYNEGKSICLTLNEYSKELNKIKCKYEIIIVDDGSKIKAKNFISGFKTKYHLIEHTKNLGYGSSISTGIANSKYNNIIITDSDNTYPANILKNMILSYQENIPCMVVASREGRNARIPFLRRPPKYFLRKLASYLCSYDIRDLNSGLRIFKKKFYRKNLRLMPKRFSMTSTLTILAAMNNYQIVYHPSDYRVRKGNSSISPIKDTLRFLNLILKLVILSDGMRIFFPISLILIIFSILILFLRFFGIPIGAATSVILFCTGLQILSFGALCKCINFYNGPK